MINRTNKIELLRAIGFTVITCIFLSFAISRITISMVVGLFLLGLNFAVSIVDYCALFGREKQEDKIVDSPGVLLAVVAVILFLDGNITMVDVLSMIVSFASGMTGFFAVMCFAEDKNAAAVLNAKSRLSFSVFVVLIAIVVDVVFVNHYSKISILSGLIMAIASVICNFLRFRYEIEKRLKLEYYNHILEEEHKHRDYIVSKWLETIKEK